MSETQLTNHLLDQSKDLIWVIDLNFQLVYANKKYLNLMKEMTGVEIKLNESVFVEGFGEGHIEKWKACYTRALNGAYFEIEEHYHHPVTNELQYTQVSFEPLTGDDHNFFAVACVSRDIKRIVKERSETNQMIDASLAIFCTINEQGNFVYVSAAAASHWGYLPEELIGIPHLDMVLEEDLPKTIETAATVLGGYELKSFVNRYKKKNGDIAYNLWSVKWDDTSKLLYCVAIDGKEKIEQEEKILQSEQRFKALVQEGSDLIAIIDQAGNYIYVSPTSTAVLGIGPEEFIGRNAFEFIHPEDAETTLASLQKIAVQNRIMVKPFRFLNHKKEWRWIESVFTNMLDNPAIKGIVANSRDITEEKKLKELNRQVRSLAKIGSWEVDLVNRSVFWSDEVHLLHETDPKSYVPNLPTGINSFVREDFQQSVKLYIEKCISTGESFDFEAVLVTAKKKEVWVRVIGNAEFANGVCKRIYGSFQDINERKEAEIRLQSLADNLPGVVFQYLIYPNGTDAIKYVSKGSQQIWGFSPEQVIQNPQLVWDGVLSGGDIEAFQKSIAYSIVSKTKWTEHWNYVMPSGETKTLLGYGSPIFLSDETVLFNTLVLDVTQEAKNDVLLKQASQMSRIGSWELDLINHNENSMYWSPMVKDIFEVDDGYKPTLEKAIEFYIGESKDRKQQVTELLIKEGIEFDEELLLLTSKGHERWCRCIGKSVMANNKRTKIYGSFQDISEQKIAAGKLQKALEEKNKILESIGDAFFAVNNEGIVTYWNKQAELVMGKKKELIVGKYLWQEYADAMDSEFFLQFHKAMKTREASNFEAFSPMLNTWLEVSGYPAEDGLSVYFKDITLRKEAEESIRDSEEKRRLIMNGALDAIICIDTNETITFWNPQAEMIFGWKEAEVMGQKLAELIVSEPFRLYYNEGIKKYLETGEGKGLNILLELTAIRRGGEEFLIELTVIPVKQGVEVFFCAFIRDITERKRAEEGIKDSEEKNRLIMNAALDAIICIDLKGDVIFWNPQAEKIFGWMPNEIIGQKLSDFIIPENLRSMHENGMNHYIKTGEAKIFKNILELAAINKSGELFPVELTVIPIKQGDEEFFCGFIRDITQRKKAEESILQANKRFEKVTEATNDAIWDWDLEKKTYYRSKAFERFFGIGSSGSFPESELWSRDYFHPEDIVNIKNSFDEAIANPLTTRWELEFRVIIEPGEILYVIDRAVIIRNKEGKAIRVVGAMTDITEQKQMTLQLSELNQSLQQHAIELEHSNEELEQFAFVASHDLQEPLRMISSFMDLLQRKYGDQLDEKGKKYIHFATDGAKRMKQIILDLLDYSRASRPTDSIEAVDMNDILAEFKLLRGQLISEKNATINSIKLPKLNIIKVAITQIFHCLLDNALKYSREGVPPIVEITFIENKNEWMFSIKDNGIGIDPQFFNKIFIIFQRLHNQDEYSGTGIGLSIAKRHVELSGGRIWLESLPGAGAVFNFTIPKNK